MKRFFRSFFVVLLIVGVLVSPFLLSYAARHSSGNDPAPLRWIFSRKGSSSSDVTFRGTDDVTSTDFITDFSELQTTESSATDSDQEDFSVDLPKPPSDDLRQKYVAVGDDYFDDALFIGDSRTDDFRLYAAPKNACYFADTGMSVYRLWKDSVAVPGVGTVDLETLLKKEKYGKIYIMLGINEIGYNISATAKQFASAVEKIRTLQPDALIFIQANFHVSREMSSKDEEYNNANLNRLNGLLKEIADGKTVFYLDTDSVYDDGTGAMPADYTYDGVHPYAKYYSLWIDYLKTKGVLTK